MRIDYEMINRCPTCENTRLQVGVCVNEAGVCSQVRWVCPECGDSDAVLKSTNKDSRRNHQMAAWAKKVKDADGNACRFCGSTADLHAHHIVPVATSEELQYIKGNGICLCAKCHEMVHNYLGGQ